MDQNLFETLLLKGESETLDFKRDQYPFDRASDDDKSELLKDILAFANAWRAEDAYILIGVEEVVGGRARKHGIMRHLEDASLQQFVSSKTQKPVAFRYEAFAINGVSFGIICIPTQHRPVFLMNRYGRLNAQVVYVRRGSATDEADPDEIAKMGIVQAPRIEPVFSVTAHPEIREVGPKCLRIILWLHNTGTGTGDDVLVGVNEFPAGEFDCNSKLWAGAAMGFRGMGLRSRNPIHPEEPVALFSINLGEVEHVLANPQTLLFSLRIWARDRPMVNLVGSFSPAELRAMQPKSLELVRK
jgi:hypothetical protein